MYWEFEVIEFVSDKKFVVKSNLIRPLINVTEAALSQEFLKVLIWREITGRIEILSQHTGKFINFFYQEAVSTGGPAYNGIFLLFDHRPQFTFKRRKPLNRRFGSDGAFDT
mmetsp:Transcript_16232/g.32420  ORF Transcript_16232/g.32420 Transcript_16232/m.32420 type:complete len:111 (+) Transcript_16232:517-849(+)